MASDAELMNCYFVNGYNYYLNIWEISHLWHNKNPQHNDILDMEVQKTIMVFSRWIQRGEINICNENGHTYDIKNGVDGQRDFLKQCYPEYSNKENKDIPTEVHNACDERLEYEGRKNIEYYNFAGDIIEIFKTQDFDKETLKKVFLDYGEVKWFCEVSNTPLPEFWFPKSEQIKDILEMNIDTKGSTKLFKILLEVKAGYFDNAPVPPKKEWIIPKIQQEYSTTGRQAQAIYTILSPHNK